MYIPGDRCMVYLLQGGIYLYQLVDWYFAAFCVLIISFLECVLIAWVYGEYIHQLQWNLSYLIFTVSRVRPHCLGLW